MSVISFAEIIKDRDAEVRVTEDGLLYAVDLVMVMTGKNREDSAKALRDILPTSFQQEKFSFRRQEKGGHPIKLLTFQDSIELVMVLPGRVAKETRAKFADIIRRYIAGDQSLISEIETNSNSASAVSQLARASLASQNRVEKKRSFSVMEIEEQNCKLNEQLSLFRNVNLVLDQYNSKKREEVEIYDQLNSKKSQEVEIQKEQNKVFQEREEIEIKSLKEKAEIQIKILKEKAEIEIKLREANVALAEKETRLALNLRKEETALQEQQQKATPLDPNPTNYQSVREIYNKNCDKFPVLKSNINSFVMMTGGKSVDLYRKKYAKEPARNHWGCFIYSPQDEELVLQALACVFRQPKYAVNNLNQQLISSILQSKKST